MPRFSKKRRAKKANTRRYNRKRLRGESLEPRLMLTGATELIFVNFAEDVIDPDDGLTSLREAILQANEVPEDQAVTIILQNTTDFEVTREGPGDENGDFDIRRQVTISGQGAPGGPGATINALGERRAFDILADPLGTPFDVTFNNVTITGGQSFQGAAIRSNSGGEVAIEFSDIVSNVATANVSEVTGGAIFIQGGSLRIENSRLEDNRAEAQDGATDSDSNPVLNGGTGAIALGGAIHATNVEITLRDSTFVNNVARGGEGGNGEITGGNGGVARGGAVFAVGGTFATENVEFLNNRAVGGSGGDGEVAEGGNGAVATGGAIHLGNGVSVATLEGSFFAENEARAGSGGDVTNAGNDAGQGAVARGGAIRTLSDSLDIVDSVFEVNIARGGRGGNSIFGASGEGGNAFGGALSIDVGVATTIS